MKEGKNFCFRGGTRGILSC